MADLKDLLGDAYKEDMTFDEVNAALAEKDLVDKSQFEGFVPKSLLEKANSEAADYKKKWKAASSEQERKAIEEAEQKAQAEEELKSLRRENNRECWKRYQWYCSGSGTYTAWNCVS